MKRRGLIILAVTALLAALVIAGCSSGGISTTTAGVGGQTTSTIVGSSAASTHVDVGQDLFSPAQEVLNAVYPAVVNIAVTATVQGQASQGVGSGIIYTSDGLILTNDHVVTLDGTVTSGQTMQVTFSNGEQVGATLVGTDSTKDVAAIKVNKTGLTTVVFGPSANVQLAQWAIVIGSPLDFRNSISLGIVSGLDRTLDLGNGQSITGLLQIDAPISPGNSGGGCFDAQGHFIGMPEVYLPPGQTGAENIGFCIPADTVAQVAKALTGR
ncbi:MAG: S1C family serine protease [Actinobacteria bacterium]|nr:S1C family serine protease [Actinomycetota bacterium]